MDLEQKIKDLPKLAGVYQYYDENGHLLYIGKAKILKNRVKSYFKFIPKLAPSDKLGPRIYKMVSEIASLEYIIVPNEYEALILENSLIKQLKPKYNILLRDDKTFPYIYVDFNLDFPRLEITRKVINKKGIKYFGPFSSGARDMLNSIYELVPLVQKKSCVRGKKTCLFFQINKCLGPCEGKITKDEYKKYLKTALDFLYNKSKLLSLLKVKMQDFMQDCLRFEDALIIRDRINSIEKSEIKSSIDLAKNQNIDIFAISHNEVEQGVVVSMFIRDGKVISSANTYFSSQNFSYDEAYKRALVNYYSQDLLFVPNDILLGKAIDEEEFLEEFIKNKFSKNIKISSPKIGQKKDLVNIALKNCEELLRIKKQNLKYLPEARLKDFFGFEENIIRIEGFDNSHMMGQAKVGAMIVYENGKFVKSAYRHYNLSARDEYGQMKEMLSARVNSFDKNPPPDLWVIDGGKTLLSLARDILASVGVNIATLGIAKEKIDAKAHRAKGKAKDIIHTIDNELRLSTADKNLQFIQRIRDESHRFAITYHKKIKLKEDKEISLLNVKGVGEATISKLLRFFETFENIKKASLEDLKELVNEKNAKLIFEYFNKKD